jgi:hypothetical protein
MENSMEAPQKPKSSQYTNNEQIEKEYRNTIPFIVASKISNT